MEIETLSKIKADIIKCFLSTPNHKKKKWAEDIIRYSPEEFSTKMDGCTNIEAEKHIVEFMTRMFLAYNFLGKDKPDWLKEL